MFGPVWTGGVSLPKPRTARKGIIARVTRVIAAQSAVFVRDWYCALVEALKQS